MKSQLIQAAVRGGHKIDTPFVRIYLLPKASSKPQLACVVGKKVHAHAVTRHRYQRLLRRFAAEARLPAMAYDMVMVAKPEILRLKKLSELQAALEPYLKDLIPSSNLP